MGCCNGTVHPDSDSDSGSRPMAPARALRAPITVEAREPITVKAVDLNVVTNTRSHFTDEYDATKEKVLVVRRGQSFEMDIEFNREFDKAKDDIRVAFKFGKLNFEFNLTDKPKAGEWSASIKSKKGNSVKISIVASETCAVGKWTFSIHRYVDKASTYKYEHPDVVYILFNPWCKADPVYLKDTDSLKEYVLNESGQIYNGGGTISSKPWAFGQFEGVVLDCIMYLLDEKSGIEESSRGDPIVISRKISALVNAPDNGGVLVGNWSGNYEAGTPPLAWVGSVGILQQYFTDKKPVQYGQCWVFSGVTTTLCRVLGLPARSVTNFSSAHDTDGSITIDSYVDEAGKPLKEYKSDSVWNFHVWNEVWMARPDLPAGFGGWQVIDATPQERSKGVYCLGPASVNAIKTGNVQLPEDAKFVFAEVNADRLTWIIKKDGSKVLLRKDTYSVGGDISTKSVKGRHREDITRQYKHQEGSKEERAAVRTAIQSSELDALELLEAYDSGQNDVKFELSTDKNTFMGDNIVSKFHLNNTSSEGRRIDGHIVVSTMYYTGVYHKEIRDHEIEYVVIAPNSEQDITVEVPEKEYLDLLMDNCMINISCLCIVKETNQTIYQQIQLRLRKPHLTVKAPNKGSVGDKIEVSVSFTNPLSVTLTDCELRVEGAGLQKPLKLQHGPVEAGKDFEATFEITPAKAGNREVMISFNSKQIRNVNASHEIVVR